LQQLWQALWFGGSNLRFRFLWLTNTLLVGLIQEPEHGTS
jgi:hypothetical protein